MTARERMAQCGAPEVHVLDPAKAARFKAKTMLIPSPIQVLGAIAVIPRGEVVPLKKIRESLAREAGADVTCPFASGQAWRLVAQASEEERAESGEDLAPWWRVTKEGKPYAKLPGGEDRHRQLLADEGMNL